MFLDWPSMTENISFASISERLIKEHAIDSDDTLVGASLGGMIALEMSCRVGCNDLTLIGSAVNRNEINQFLLALSSLSWITPLRFIQVIAGKSGGELGRMFSHVDTDFIHSTCRELRSWEPPKGDTHSITRIHGAKDHVIPCPEEADLILDGGHLVAMTHAQECVDCLAEGLTDRVSE
jgi:pimeloyl-ACP methyl ester carboxylesterase